MNNWIIDSVIFNHPFTCTLAGPSGCGKTTLLQKILINKNEIFDRDLDRIVFCYKSMQPSYDVFNLLDSPVEFVQGLINVEEFDESKSNLLIIDDLMEECKDNKDIATLFSVHSHHKSISVFLVTQNIFMQGKCARDINLNSTNLIIFNNPRDRQQIRVLGQQMYPKKTLGFMEAFDDAIKQHDGHGYIFLDFKQQTQERMRIQTGIIPGEERIIYTIN